MDERTAFDATPDPELGALLREVLEAGDDTALVARIVAGFDAQTVRPRPFVEVLAGWARAGAVVAAVAATLALYFALPREAPAPVPTLLEATMTESPSQSPAAALVSSDRPPDPNSVFAVSFEP
jgi:hypothetical protein